MEYMKNKIILVDAWNALFTENGIDKQMQEILDTFENKKIVATNADDEEIIKFGIDKSPYKIFTLKHNPNKDCAIYYQELFKKYDIVAENVIYFEHNLNAVKSAQKNNILTFHFHKDKRNLGELRKFLNSNL